MAPQTPPKQPGEYHQDPGTAVAAEQCVHRHRGCRRTAPPPEESQPASEPPASSPWPTGYRFAERTRAKRATIRALLAVGHSKRSIARQLGMGFSTVLHYAHAAEPEQLFNGQWQSRPTSRPTLTSDCKRAGPTPGNCGRKSTNKVKVTRTRTAIAAFAPTSAGISAASLSRPAPGRRRLPASSPAGFSASLCPRGHRHDYRPSGAA